MRGVNYCAGVLIISECYLRWIVPVIGCAEEHPSKTASGVNVFRGDGVDGVPAGGRVAPDRGVARLSPRNATAEDASGIAISSLADVSALSLGHGPPPAISGSCRREGHDVGSRC